jgi:hypothetical protein
MDAGLATYQGCWSVPGLLLALLRLGARSRLGSPRGTGPQSAPSVANAVGRGYLLLDCSAGTSRVVLVLAGSTARPLA